MDQIKPFIENHQMNFVNKQIDKLIYAVEHVSDTSVIEALKYHVEATIMSSFHEISEVQKQLLKSFWNLNSQEQITPT